ncbi:MAG: type 4a pilus biogenesis protein PilO [Desulfobacterales bacterium]|nr:type 4a pilus biogenesis protein PilO [Desulfobacterales bacterium]
MRTEDLFEKVEQIRMVHRVLIFVGTVVLSAGLFIYFSYIPTTKEISMVTGQVADLTKKVNEARRIAANLEKFKEEKAEADAQLQKALALLPKEREIPSLLRTITELGLESNLEFRLFSLKKETPKDLYIEIPVSIEVKGRYHDVAVFFDKVGRMKRLVNILDVSIVPEKQMSTTLKATCTAITYRFRGA